MYSPFNRRLSLHLNFCRSLLVHLFVEVYFCKLLDCDGVWFCLRRRNTNLVSTQLNSTRWGVRSYVKPCHRHERYTTLNHLFETQTTVSCSRHVVKRTCWRLICPRLVLGLENSQKTFECCQCLILRPGMRATSSKHTPTRRDSTAIHEACGVLRLKNQYLTQPEVEVGS